MSLDKRRKSCTKKRFFLVVSKISAVFVMSVRKICFPENILHEKEKEERRKTM